MLSRTLMAIVVGGSFLVAAPIVSPQVSYAYADSKMETAAIDLVEKLGSEAVSILSDKTLSNTEKQDKFAYLVERDFDMNVISRFVLGKNWRKASDDEKAEYQDLFQTYIIKTYQKRIGEYSGENLKIIKSKPLNKKEYLVNSEIIRPKGPKINLDWRVRESKSGELKIIDIMVENVSMALTHRDEFTSVISQNGGKVAALIEKLRSHIAEASN
ncbi:MlaC/ttg2D family ABC transporter substrate-binding protein [Sneathiella limimaris]|uniref:MlaC/ttg2D family ABC transporter substrate-binding protein n=1 Tax=Sneathiella limimaris TaxID=1964213 RepID=UPI00146A5750|nr:ABC transporter substrate-binding protein [Sneathiella limimaris]